MTTTETIRVEHLDTGYHNKNENIVISRDINASLYSGQLACLLGPNGAGKSTLLKTLTAFIPPIAGNIYIAGKSLESYSEASLAKVLGMVLTEKLNVENMTAYELVGLGRSPYTGFWGKLSDYDKEIVDKAFNLVGIDTLKTRLVQTLSDGERQKVMIAKALAQETPIIFLDEPTAFLDYPSKVEIMLLLRKLTMEQNKTVFMSTHDLDLAIQMADSIWLIDKVYGVNIGTAEELALSGSLEKYFCREGVEFDAERRSFRISDFYKRNFGNKNEVASLV